MQLMFTFDYIASGPALSELCCLFASLPGRSQRQAACPEHLKAASCQPRRSFASSSGKKRAPQRVNRLSRPATPKLMTCSRVRPYEPPTLSHRQTTALSVVHLPDNHPAAILSPACAHHGPPPPLPLGLAASAPLLTQPFGLRCPLP